MLGCICTVWFTKHGAHDPESDVDVFSITAEYFWKSVSFKGTQDGNNLTKQWYFCCHGRRTERDNNWQTDARVMCLRVPEGERETKNFRLQKGIRGRELDRDRERENHLPVFLHFQGPSLHSGAASSSDCQLAVSPMTWLDPWGYLSPYPYPPGWG